MLLKFWLLHFVNWNIFQVHVQHFIKKESLQIQITDWVFHDQVVL